MKVPKVTLTIPHCAILGPKGDRENYLQGIASISGKPLDFGLCQRLSACQGRSYPQLLWIYTIAIEGMREDESAALLAELFAHQVRAEFVYRHQWASGMLVMWDNRCLVHAATGGYDGHQRLLHRITVADKGEPAIA